MSKVELCLLLIVAGISGLYGCERPAARPPTTRPAQATDYDDQYVAALASADAFCQAWKQRDEAAGRALLSKRFLRKYPDSRIADAIVGRTGPDHAAYEIASGRRLGPGRYGFDVKLLFTYSGLHGARIEPADQQVVVVRDPAGNWKVDRFPVPTTPAGGRSEPIVLPEQQ